MGFYVNPKNGATKEDWLQENGVQVSPAPTVHMDEQNRVAVCLVDNGMFSAAGIAFCQDELEVFRDPDDRRFKRWFLVDTSMLEPFMEGQEIVR